MSEFDTNAAKKSAGTALTRRSLVAAVGILASVGPLAAGKALAQQRPGEGGGYPGVSGYPGGGGGYSRGGGGYPGGGNGYPGGGSSNGARASCFLSGTQVLTPRGEVAIETLAVGDTVITKDGTAKAIRWVGKMTFERDGQSWAPGVKPIRIQKGALGNGCPHRDLYLSRTHMLLLNGVLIPAGDLVNGTTIAAIDVDTDALEYFHVELDQHDVLVAEGVACETLLAKAGHHNQFDNANEYVELFGAAASIAMLPCAPVVAHCGRRGALASRLRSAVAPVIDIRNRADVVRDHLEERALRAA